MIVYRVWLLHKRLAPRTTWSVPPKRVTVCAKSSNTPPVLPFLSESHREAKGRNASSSNELIIEHNLRHAPLYDTYIQPHNITRIPDLTYLFPFSFVTFLLFSSLFHCFSFRACFGQKMIDSARSLAVPWIWCWSGWVWSRG